MSSCESHSIVSLFVTPWIIQSIEFSRPEYWSGLPCSPPGDLPNPGIGPRSSALQADSLPAEPQGKPKNIGVSGLSLHQWIFPTQESNWGLSHCRWILYQLSSHRILISSVQSLSHACHTPSDPMDCSTPGFPVHQQLQELTQTHVPLVSDTIQPSHPVSSPSPAFHLAQHQGLF